MQTENRTSVVPPKKPWAGYILSAIPALFMLFDAVGKLVKPAVVVTTTVELGYPASVLTGLGITLLISTLLYIFPRTSVLGAILLTGYLGGAVATHVRVGGPLFAIVFPALVGAMVWGGLYLRDARVRELLPLRK